MCVCRTESVRGAEEDEPSSSESRAASRRRKDSCDTFVGRNSNVSVMLFVFTELESRETEQSAKKRISRPPRSCTGSSNARTPQAWRMQGTEQKGREGK